MKVTISIKYGAIEQKLPKKVYRAFGSLSMDL